MAYAVNKVILVGNLGKDPEMRYTQSGKAVVRFTLATSDRGRDGQDRTEWHNVVAWDKLAELVNRLVVKGNKVYVEGRLQTREYNDRDGNRRWSTEVVAREMVFFTTERQSGGRDAGPPSGGWNEGPPGPPGAPSAAAPSQNPTSQSPTAQQPPGGEGGGGAIPYTDDEDIPF